MINAREDLSLHIEGHGENQEHEQSHLEDEKHKHLVSTVSDSISEGIEAPYRGLDDIQECSRASW